jgi:hypothetical protein
MSRSQKIRELTEIAKAYLEADKKLEKACGEEHDVIACTVFALQCKHLSEIPEESFSAAEKLKRVTELHEELVTEYKMDPDKVRAIWFPILNEEK